MIIELEVRVKKFLTILLLLSLISCTPFVKSNVMNIPTYTVTFQLSATSTASSEVTATQHPASIATVELSTTTTNLPSITTSQPVFSIIERKYKPSEWKVLYDKSSVWKIELDSNEQLWILTWENIGYFDGNNWLLYSEKDYGLTYPTDMAVSSDGTVWLVSPKEISQYRDGFWNVFSIPDAPEISSPRLAIDMSNLVWLAFSDCHCENPIRTFDGINWNKQSLWSFGEADQLLFTPEGILWASNNGLIGQFIGKTWVLYGRIRLWPRFSDFNFQIASDSHGNIYGIDYGQEWVVKINNDGSISKVPFDMENFELNPIQMRLFIDKQGRIWTNACHKYSNKDCLAYYQDNQWIYFNNLPFNVMLDMDELSDGTLLVATTQGLFQYKPEN